MIKLNELRIEDLLGLAFQAAGKKDLTMLMRIDKELDNRIEAKEKKAEKSLEKEQNEMLEKLESFFKLDKELGKIEKEIKTGKNKSINEVFDEAREAAYSNNPELEFVIGIETQILSTLNERERVQYMIDKYEDVRASMLDKMESGDKIEIELGLAGAIATYELVISDLKRVLK